MGDKSLIERLSMQADLGRTSAGWDLGDGMPGATLTSRDAAGGDGFSATECLNCAIVLSSDFFASGCPNCGCKDTRAFGGKAVTTVAGMAGSVVTGEVKIKPGDPFRFYVIDQAQVRAKGQP